MSDGPLSEQIDRLLETAIRDTASSVALADLHDTLIQARQRLKEPMRVAIVGLIKAGKSTVMNALLGEDVVATGTIETTFNINWLCFGKDKALEVHFKDNRPAQRKSFEELNALTRRPEEREAFLLSIKYIKVYFPNEMLHTLQLIDTPGLESVHKEDSQNTLDFMQVHGRELSEVTQREAKQADAVLYLFSQSISASLERIIEEFQGPFMGASTPINSIGVLTRVDSYWPGEPGDPLATGERVAKRLSLHPRAQRSLYTILPVNGLLALGAQTLTVTEFAWLEQLATLPVGKLRSIIRDAEGFITNPFEGVAVLPEQRKALYLRLGQYGIWRACELLRAGTTDRQQLRQCLYEESGLPRLHKIILSHFGNRAFLIKLDSALRSISAITFRLRQSLTGTDFDRAGRVSSTFEEVAVKQEGIRELQVLRLFYEGKLTLSADEVQLLLQITGEAGTAYWQRLGIQQEPALTAESLEYAHEIALKQKLHWQQRLLAPGLDRNTKKAVGIMVRAYEGIIGHIQQLQRHINFFR